MPDGKIFAKILNEMLYPSLQASVWPMYFHPNFSSAGNIHIVCIALIMTKFWLGSFLKAIQILKANNLWHFLTVTFLFTISKTIVFPMFTIIKASTRHVIFKATFYE